MARDSFKISGPLYAGNAGFPDFVGLTTTQASSEPSDDLIAI